MLHKNAKPIRGLWQFPTTNVNSSKGWHYEDAFFLLNGCSGFGRGESSVLGLMTRSVTSMPMHMSRACRHRVYVLFLFASLASKVSGCLYPGRDLGEFLRCGACAGRSLLLLLSLGSRAPLTRQPQPSTCLDSNVVLDTPAPGSSSHAAVDQLTSYNRVTAPDLLRLPLPAPGPPPFENGTDAFAVGRAVVESSRPPAKSRRAFALPP
jgi:hypothetical protein